MAAPVSATEIRLLEGPNLYFTRPALKVSLSLPGYLGAPTAELTNLVRRLGMRARVGSPGSVQRRTFILRLPAFLIRAAAKRAGTSRVGVRVRPGGRPEDVVVAAVWRSRGRAEILADGLAPLLTDLLAGADAEPLVIDLAARMNAAPRGRPATVISPSIPVVSITGTNGKTTTTRLVAHIAMTAGKKTAWSSTDGVVVMGEVVEPGDYSGPAGARGVLQTPDLEIGVLETARGGLLLKGMGVTHNDVSVVTNVSADHLGLQGIDTVDQLAEVKAIVTTVTKPSGWTVLNGEDPRAWAMRARSPGRPWAFALDPSAPALREAIDAGGRGITIADGDVTILHPGGRTERLLALRDIPATLSGLSVHNIANALAGAAAALGLGLPVESVIDGLRTFVPDDVLNPGRMNIYSLPLNGGSVSVILDLAHNEAGLEALLDVARGLTPSGGRVLLALGTAGDRTDDILAALGEIAGQRADVVVVAHKDKYLRDRSTADFETHFGLGLGRAGRGSVPSYGSELAALEALAALAADGDVIAIMSHEQRLACVDWLHANGATADLPGDIRAKVTVAQGRHDLDGEFEAIWAEDDPAERIARASALHTAHPADARVTFEYAGALDAGGQTAAAIEHYESALSSGLREPYRHRARIQLASSLRLAARAEAASALFAELATERPESAAVTAFAALAGVDAGRGNLAVADLIDALLARATDDDARLYQAALGRYAADLRRASTGTTTTPPVR